MISILLVVLVSSTTTIASSASRHKGALSSGMLNSIIARGQGLYGSAASTSLIELGIFQQALGESVAVTCNPTEKAEWESYLEKSTLSSVDPLANSTLDAGLPLDRLSIGAALISQYASSGDQRYLRTIKALRKSLDLQPRNANGGLWYYANPTNLSHYHNLSYLDGMYSYSPFAILAPSLDLTGYAPQHTARVLGPAAALKQLCILYRTCKLPSGLLAHGYDASKAHKWSNPVTGASPVVWGRSLAWYTLGTIWTLALLQSSPRYENVIEDINSLLNSIAEAQVCASEHTLQMTGNYGVWQVVDHPGDPGNFVEASASCMTVYSLLKSVRLGFIGDPSLQQRAVASARGIYFTVLQNFLFEAANGTLSLNGTSSVASLSGEDVDYEVSVAKLACSGQGWTLDNTDFEQYYVTRPTVTNSLIGTSAFVLASLEIEKLM